MITVSVVDCYVNSHGYATMWLQAAELENNCETRGPVHGYGIDAETLAANFDGDLGKFAASKKDEVIERLQRFKTSLTAVESLKGKVL